MRRLVVAFVLGVMAVPAQQPSEKSPASRPAETIQQQQVKEQALVIPQGSSIEVKLFNGKKLRGRIGQVSDAGVALRAVFENKIEERTIPFTDIKSVRYYNPMMPRMIVSYIALAVSTAVSIALAATR